MAIVFAVVTITFFVVHLAQGTPCGGERPLPPDVCERERAVFGYDKPLQVQYVKYLAALLHGKMGYSFGLHRPVADALADAIPNTFTLARSEEHTSELQSLAYLVCRLLLEKKKTYTPSTRSPMW